MFDEDPMEALSRCQNLLEEPQASIIIRPGDIYAIMIRELVDKERFKSVCHFPPVARPTCKNKRFSGFFIL